jgi:multisubunit Na+/H+ antiporter MnhE subunit
MSAVVWFGIALGLWTLWVAQPTLVNWVAGIAVAALTAVAARVVASRGLLSHTFRRSWLPLLAAVPWQIVVDFWLVTRELAVAVATRDRGTRGSFVTAAFDAGGDTARGRSWRAFVTLAATLSPNSYVIDIDRDNARRTNHDLVRNAASERPA